MKLSDKQKLWIKGKAELTVEALPEDTDVKGNAMASGNADLNRAWEDQILADLLEGKTWSWCTIKVTLRWHDWEGTDYLGCCSYRSKADFIENSGYFPDMVKTASEELFTNIENAGETFEILARVEQD